MSVNKYLASPVQKPDMGERQQMIIQLLARGFTQKEISEMLKAFWGSPCSLSYVEKELKKIRKEYRAETNFHLAVILIKRGIIKP